MALDRTWYNTLIDDDGSNTVGTPWDKADVDALMDAIDVALAAVAGGAGPFPESAITGLVADLALKAPLASPALTGTPTAPTAAGGTNTTQVSTTAFVAAAIAALVASSPSTLDTLNELALALGSDPNFATTMATALGLKAPLASPALTGTPTAPTAAAGTSTTQIATTAFVQNAANVPRVTSVASSATPAPNADTTDLYDLTALAAAAAFANPTGTPVNGQKLIIRIKDNATARALTWGSAYVAGGVALPSTTVLSKILTLGFLYNTANALNKWQCVAASQEA
jgi:hypothetical protein